jgi:hypothetical protein
MALRPNAMVIKVERSPGFTGQPASMEARLDAAVIVVVLQLVIHQVTLQ